MQVPLVGLMNLLQKRERRETDRDRRKTQKGQRQRHREIEIQRYLLIQREEDHEPFISNCLEKQHSSRGKDPCHVWGIDLGGQGGEEVSRGSWRQKRCMTKMDVQGIPKPQIWRCFITQHHCQIPKGSKCQKCLRLRSQTLNIVEEKLKS